MSLRGFSGSYRYQINKLIKVIPAAILLTFAVFMLMTGFMNYTAEGVFSLREAILPGADAYTAVEILLFAAYFSFDFYNTSAANGVSRLTTLAASAASYFTVSAAGALIVSVIYPILAAATGSQELWIMELIYGTRVFMHLYGESVLVFRLRMFILTLFCCILFALIGIAFGSLMYKLPRKAGIALALIVVMVPNIASNAVMIYCESHGLDYSEMFDRFFMSGAKLFGFARANGKMAGDMGKGIFMGIVFSAVCAGIAGLAARRAAVKPAAIRND